MAKFSRTDFFVKIDTSRETVVVAFLLFFFFLSSSLILNINNAGVSRDFRIAANTSDIWLFASIRECTDAGFGGCPVAFCLARYVFTAGKPRK